MRLSILLSIFLLLSISCSSINKSRKRFASTSLAINGGVSETGDWSDKLTFKRYSWRKETSLTYDILMAKLNSDSPFVEWMGNDRYKMKGCSSFYVGLFYAKPLAAYSANGLQSMFESQGYEALIIPEFKDNLDAHPNSIDWKINSHELVGLCRTDNSTGSIKIKVPGYKKYKLK